jgi:HD-like signal output (HDOD) protein
MKSPDYIRDKIKSILQLPALPAHAYEVVELVDNPKSSAAQLSKTISADPALSAKVLRMANSPYYGFQKKISTIDFAIIVLGFDTLKEIVISISLMSALQNNQDKQLDLDVFWDHSLSSAILARKLARETGYRLPSEAFMAGLLHDLGILVIHKYFHADYMKIQALIREADMPPLRAEESILGVTHADVGRWLAERWNLPTHLCETIAFHHTTESMEDKKLAALIQIADVVSNAGLHPPFDYDKGLTFNRSALQVLGLDGDEVLIKYADANSTSGEYQNKNPEQNETINVNVPDQIQDKV